MSVQSEKEHGEALTFAIEVASHDNLVTARLSYQEYIRSGAWYRKRYGALQRAENRCQVCNSPEQLQVHHRSYQNLGSEKPSDLVVLCECCHKLFHEHRKLAVQP